VRTVPSHADAPAACALLLADLRGDRDGVAALLEDHPRQGAEADLVAGFGTVLASAVATALPFLDDADDPEGEVDAFVEKVLLVLIAEFARLEVWPEREDD
jgi:hypothetical protein